MYATVWHNPDCGTSRKVLALLNGAKGVTVEMIEYRKQPFSRETLLDLFRAAELLPSQALRTRGSRAEELGLIHGATADEIVAAMVDHPILVERPFVRTSKGVRLCRPAEKIFDIL